MKEKTPVFDLYGRYYNLMYRHKNYADEVNYLINTFSRFSDETPKFLLEFGSGTAKHACLLAQFGYDVFGVELSQKMIDLIEARPGVTVIQGDIRTIQIKKKFDAVFSMFHVMSYQVREQSVLNVFKRAYEHLDAGGLFVFDFWYTPAVNYQKPSIRVHRVEDEELQVIRLAEPVIIPNENRVDVGYTIFVRDNAEGLFRAFTEVHSMRHFSIYEIEALANQQGFDCLSFEELVTRKSPSKDTWALCAILRRR